MRIPGQTTYVVVAVLRFRAYTFVSSRVSTYDTAIDDIGVERERSIISNASSSAASNGSSSRFAQIACRASGTSNTCTETPAFGRASVTSRACSAAQDSSVRLTAGRGDSCQVLFCVLQIGRIETLGKRRVDRLEKLFRCALSVRRRPQTHDGDRGPELERARLLRTCDGRAPSPNMTGRPFAIRGARPSVARVQLCSSYRRCADRKAPPQ